MSILEEPLKEFAEVLPWWGKWIFTLIIAMLPVIELRGSLPIALGLGLKWWVAILLSIIGNMIPIPFILLFFEKIERFLRRWKFFERFFDRLFESTRRKGERKLQVWGDLGLIFFVAIPLPITGAWTGSLVAYLLKLDRKKAFLSIFVGVVIAGFIVSFIELLNSWFFAVLTILILAIVLLSIWFAEKFFIDRDSFN